jgi:hypothetical protein
MIYSSATAITTALPESVWRLYADVANWNRWDDGVEWSRVDGEFGLGARGRLKPRGGPAVPFRVTACVPGELLVDVSSLPLCRIEFTHRLVREGDRTRITHEVRFAGPLGFFFKRVIGPGIRTGLPGAVAGLVRLAEGREGA